MTVEQMRERLAAIRAAKGWTVEQLTADIGLDRISTGTVRRLLVVEGAALSRTTQFVLRTYLHGKRAA